MADTKFCSNMQHARVLVRRDQLAELLQELLPALGTANGVGAPHRRVERVRIEGAIAVSPVRRLEHDGRLGRPRRAARARPHDAVEDAIVARGARITQAASCLLYTSPSPRDRG